MLAEGVPNHLLFLDRELRIVFANDVFLEAAGWSKRQAVGLHISDVVGVERFMERQQYYERALAGETVSYESTGAAGNEERLLSLLLSAELRRVGQGARHLLDGHGHLGAAQD